MYKLILKLIIPCLVCAFSARGEGTRQLRPQEDNNGFLFLSDDNTFTQFGQYNAPAEEQIRIRIDDPDEVIYFGFSNRLEDGDNFTPDVEFRILDPDGNVAYGPDNFPTDGNPGFINNYNEAVAGPAGLGNAGGYDALTFDPVQAGNYVLEFDISDIPDDNDLYIDLFDITVADANGNATDGRLHSKGWQLTTGGLGDDFGFYGNVFPRGDNGVVYEVDFNEMQPYSFVLNFNSYGVQQGGDFIENRRSQSVSDQDNYTAPEYDIFLSPPDTAVYPVNRPEITFSGSTYRTDCENHEYCLNFSSNQEGVLEGYIDVDEDGTYDSTNGDVYLSEYFSGDTTRCIPWDGRDANGNLVDTEQLNVYARFGNGQMHLPLFDVEDNQNGFDVDIVRPAGSDPPLLFWDDVNIQDKDGQNLDGVTSLQGCDGQNAGGCHQWEGRGEDNDNSEIINTWWYTEMAVDTITFDASVNEAVSLSYDPDDLEQGDSTVCRGDSLAFFVYDGGGDHYNTDKYLYEWYMGDSLLAVDTGRQTLRIDSAVSLRIAATLREADSCVFEDTLHIDTEQPVEVSATLSYSNCLQEARIDVNADQGPPDPVFMWQQFPDSTSGTLRGLTTGTYQLRVADTAFSGRCAFDTTFTVNTTLNDEVQLSYSPDALIQTDSTLCRGDSVMLYIYDGGNDHYDESKYHYKWYVNGNYTAMDTGSMRLSVDEPTAVRVMAVQRAVGFCITWDTMQVDVVDPVALSADINDVSCSGDGAIDVQIEQGPPDPVFSWQAFPGSSFDNLNGLSPGTYQLRVADPAFSDRCALDTGFTVADTRSIGIDSFAVQGTGCYEHAGMAAVFMEDPGKQYEYNWNNQGYGTNSELHNLPADTHQLSIRTQDCIIDTTFDIPRFSPGFDVSTRPDTCHAGLGMIRFDHVDTVYTDLQWHDIPGDKIRREGLTAGTYQFSLSNPARPGCRVDSFVAVPDHRPVLDADFSFSQNPVRPDDTLDLRNLSQGDIDSVYWDFGDGHTSSAYDPVYAYAEEGRYPLSLQVYHRLGCADTASQFVEVKYPVSCDIAVPNAFSPNNDGMNEDIGVLGNVNVISFTIFNRWGEVIFRSHSRDERWDGTYRNEAVPVGVYPYVLRYQCPENDDKVDEKVGDITLVR